jgi:hypothetical protein
LSNNFRLQNHIVGRASSIEVKLISHKMAKPLNKELGKTKMFSRTFHMPRYGSKHSEINRAGLKNVLNKSNRPQSEHSERKMARPTSLQGSLNISSRL